VRQILKRRFGVTGEPPAAKAHRTVQRKARLAAQAR